MATACSKISQSSLQGEWTVESIQVREITLRATNFDIISADGGLLVLNEQYRDTDLLGNVRKEINTKVQLLRKGE